MELQQQSRDLLVFATAPHTVRQMNRLGAIWLVINLLFLPWCVYRGRVEELRCDRQDETTINCTIQRWQWWGLQRMEKLDLPGVQTVTDDDQGRTVLSNGSETAIWSPYRYDARRLNFFLQDIRQERYIIRYDRRFVYSLAIVGAIGAMRIAWLMLRWRGNLLRFQAKSRTIAQLDQGLWSLVAREHHFRDIDQVELREFRDRDRRLQYQVNVCMKTTYPWGWRRWFWLGNFSDHPTALNRQQLIKRWLQPWA